MKTQHTAPQAPPDHVIRTAVKLAAMSPCAKSKRGVVVFSLAGTHADGHGFNHPPFGTCAGTDECRSSCSKICEHAEAMALRQTVGEGLFDMLHVKVVDGEPVPSGGPSCWQCSKAILADQRIAGVWLLHADGWRRYDVREFHALTLKECGLLNTFVNMSRRAS